MGLRQLILRGEIYDVELGRPVGHEPALHRPGVVMSTDRLVTRRGLANVDEISRIDHAMRFILDL